MPTADFIAFSEALSNGNVVQLAFRLVTTPTTSVLSNRLILRDEDTGNVIRNVQLPSPTVSPLPVDAFGPFGLIPLDDGGFGVVVATDSELFFTTFTANLVRTGSAEIGSAGTNGFIFVDSVIQKKDGGAIISVTEFGANTGINTRVVEIEPTGQINGPEDSQPNAPNADGIELENGNFVTIGQDLSSERPVLSVEYFSPDLQLLDTETVATTNTSSFLLIPMVKLEPLPTSDRFVTVWAQVRGAEITGPSGLFIGFGDLSGEPPFGGLTDIVQVDTNVADNFDVLVMPDGSFIVAWSGNVEPGLAADAAINEGQVRWQHFDSDGNALNTIQDIGSGSQNELGVALNQLGNDGAFLLTTSSFLSDFLTASLGGVPLSVPLGPVVERLTDGDDIFIGNLETQIVEGLGGDDSFETRAGDDTVDAGAGDDTVNAGTGNDLVEGGAGNDILIGLSGDDILDGGAGNDILNGGSGADILIGGAGSDTADYSDANNRVRADLQAVLGGLGEANGDTYDDVENLIGSRKNDILFGDAQGNLIQGGNFFDRLTGRAGDDRLEGQGGADAIAGNAGADILTGGGAGRDRFIYFNLSDSRAGHGNRDTITDFVAGEDRIEVSRIDANTTIAGNQAFELIGSAGFSGAGGELRFFQAVSLDRTVLRADVDGDRQTDFEIILDGLIDLTENDFLL